ncbi:MAG: endolytic transglycosylase MltG [Chitinophagaceae bacterium]
MKKLVFILLGTAFLTVAWFGWKIIGPATWFDSPLKYLYIPTNNATRENVVHLLEKDSILRNSVSFSWLAGKMNYWKQIKPGKYKIERGSSPLHILRLLRNGQQSPVNLIITKLRTKEDLASLAGRRFECDSLAIIRYLNDNDSLKQFALDTSTVMTAVFPDTYTFFWNTTPEKIFSKLIRQYNSFWTSQRILQAKEKGLTPQTAYILASIVEEETNKNDEKGNIASVYLNRMNIGMKLGADPTVKFALRDFELKRIYYKHLAFESPYNTYRINGLPPGPICTPSVKTLEAVLQSPKTDYLYFVAKSDFSGYHSFAVNYEDHKKYARLYQEALNKYMQQKKLPNGSPDN